MSYKLTVPSMACNVCGETITKAILAIDSQATVVTNPQTKLVVIESNYDEVSLRKAIESAGYPVS
jgi:copper chaperone